MRAFSNYNNVASYTDSIKLPAGAYKVRVIRAEEQSGKNNSCALCILFDIAEGEFANYYHQKFASEKRHILMTSNIRACTDFGIRLETNMTKPTNER